MFWMLPAKVSGHQVTPSAPGWPGTDLRCSEVLGEHQPCSGVRTERSFQLWQSQPQEWLKHQLPTAEAFEALICTKQTWRRAGQRFHTFPLHLQVYVGNERQDKSSSGVSTRETWPSLCSTRGSAAHRTGFSPGWINFSPAPSILPPVGPPWLLLLLWASSRSQPAKHSVGEVQEGPAAINTSSYHRRHSCGLGSAKSSWISN